MGYMAHHVVVATAYDFQLTGENPYWPAVINFEAWREEQPEEFRHLLIGPIPSVTNGYLTFMLAPDGSKEGWDTSDIGDDLRGAFIELFAQNHIDCVEVRFGGDEPDLMWIEDRSNHREEE